MDKLLCERCHKYTSGCLTMSWFNSEMICSDCSQIEKKHPLYEVARKAVENAEANGSENYPGIGLPEDLSHKDRSSSV